MMMGKIGAKSAAFINHKPFHPGTFENLERVWMAEEKDRQAKQRVQEIMEKREEERKITELRKALRERNKDVSIALGFHDKSDLIEDRRKKKQNNKKRKKNDTKYSSFLQEKSRKLLSSRYQEDIFPADHTTIFGSYYCTQSNKWGFACCKNLIRDSKCIDDKTNNPASHVVDEKIRSKANIEGKNFSNDNEILEGMKDNSYNKKRRLCDVNLISQANNSAE